MGIFEHYKHLNLSSSQHNALLKIDAFLNSPAQVFMLKGYAGSGKTTILKGLVDYLESIEKDYALMAPTGRAAKVIQEKTGYEAYTIHKTIYSYDDMAEVSEDGESFYYYYKIRNSKDSVGTIFIIDEASMISDAKNESEFFRFGTSHLLSDLISFSRVDQPNSNSKIIFVGDPCQLPPVGDNSSKAFDIEYLKGKFKLLADEAEIKEIHRQNEGNNIIKAASNIRKSISAGFYNDFNISENGKDIFNPPYKSFLNKWEQTNDSKIIIASKNKTCLDINLQIRERKFGDPNLPVQVGDIVIMGGNNYRKGVFNGEFAVVNKVTPDTERRTIGLKGKAPVTLNWRNIELIFPDAENNNKIVVGKMLENFLNGDNVLRPEEIQALRVDFKIRYPELKPRTVEFKDAILKDEYFNCLLMKYGYAVTCHKAQGGEWENVFTIWDHDNAAGFNHNSDLQRRAGKTNQSFYRWAYTAITRASRNLFALNPPCFNSYSSMAFIEMEVQESLSQLDGVQHMSEDVEIDRELLKQLTIFGLLDQPIPLQDHFIKIRHVLRKQYIELSGWEKKGYEIRYTFQRENDQAVFKTYINGKNEFKNNFAVIPAMSLSLSFNNDVQELLSNLPEVSVKRNTVDTVLGKIEFDLEAEEKFPFTKNLFEDLSTLLFDNKIIIDELEHLQYKERYTFKKGSEIAVLDFEYKGNGFFGRIVPLWKKSSSQALISKIKEILQTFKEKEYAS